LSFSVVSFFLRDSNTGANFVFYFKSIAYVCFWVFVDIAIYFLTTRIGQFCYILVFLKVQCFVLAFWQYCMFIEKVFPLCFSVTLSENKKWKRCEFECLFCAER